MFCFPTRIRALIVCAGLLAGSLAGCQSQQVDESATLPSDVYFNNTDAVTMSVTGLGCPQCATSVEKTVGRLKGVRDVAIDLGEGTVTVRVDQAGGPSDEQLQQAITDAGFTVQAINR